MLKTAKEMQEKTRKVNSTLIVEMLCNRAEKLIENASEKGEYTVKFYAAKSRETDILISKLKELGYEVYKNFHTDKNEELTIYWI